jgi:multiple sugar transport system permease protein
MTFPSNLAIVVQYLIYDTIGWVNTPLPVIVPRMLGGFSIVFFLAQYYRGVPNDLCGTAKLDGLNDWGIFLRIMLPISTPVFFAQFIIQFIGAYNDYMGPLLYLTDDRLYTMSLLLSKFGDQKYVQEWNLKMAGCVLGMAPLVLLYCLSQKFILKGMAITSGLKG